MNELYYLYDHTISKQCSLQKIIENSIVNEEKYMCRISIQCSRDSIIVQIVYCSYYLYDYTNEITVVVFPTHIFSTFFSILLPYNYCSALKESAKRCVGLSGRLRKRIAISEFSCLRGGNCE